MSAPVEDLLIEYALGTLDGGERSRVDDALQRSAELRAELQAIEETFTGIALGLPPVPPSESARSRLLAAVEADRFGPFVARLAELFDLARDRMRAVLQQIDQAASWEAGPVPGLELIHFQGGPSVAGADTGFVRLPAGFTFPYHRHKGNERVFVLEGEFTDLVTNEVHRPGELVFRGAGSEHAFVVGKDRDLIFAVVLEVGFEIIPPPQ